MSGRSAFHISARKEMYLNTLSHDGGATADLKYIDQKVLCAKTTKENNQVDSRMFGCYGDKPPARCHWNIWLILWEFVM